jgi:hypothetical protein
MLNKKIVYTLKSSLFNRLEISIEEEGTAIIFNSGDEYNFTLSLSEVKELQEILADIVNESEIIKDMKIDAESWGC